MSKRIKSIIFVMCAVMIFTAQESRSDDNKQKQDSDTRSMHSGPKPVKAPQQLQRGSPARQEVSKQEAPRQELRQAPPAETVRSQAVHQDRGRPIVYAVTQSAPVENNNFLHRQHHKHWQPRYNFYDDQYHFYPYVNIAATVELSADGESIGFNGQTYYYDQGTFYIQDTSGQYVAVAPPVGIIVNPIAVNARQIIVNGQVFYRYKGVFYVQVAQGYQVIGPLQTSSDDS